MPERPTKWSLSVSPVTPNPANQWHIYTYLILSIPLRKTLNYPHLTASHGMLTRPRQ